MSVDNNKYISRKIILFGQRRNGTTMAFNLFRQISDIRCYYEPFHPNLLKNPHWKGLSEIDRDTKLVYSEYKTLNSNLSRYFCPLGAPVFPIEQELETKYWSKNHTRYLRYLFGTAKNVLLQPVRVNYHLKEIYSEFPNVKFIWILRNPEGVVSSLMKRHPMMFDLKENPFNVYIYRHYLKIINWFNKTVLNRNDKTRLNTGYWSQDFAANYLIKIKPRYNIFKNYPLWFKLMLAWYDSVKSVERSRQLIPLDQFAVIRYEDVCYDPNDIMIRLCDWLKIDLPLINFRKLVYAEPQPIYKEEDNRWQWAKSILKELHRECANEWSYPVKTRIGVQ